MDWRQARHQRGAATHGTRKGGRSHRSNRIIVTDESSLSEGLRPSDSPTRALARRFYGSAPIALLVRRAHSRRVIHLGSGPDGCLTQANRCAGDIK